MAAAARSFFALAAQAFMSVPQHVGQQNAKRGMHGFPGGAIRHVQCIASSLRDGLGIASISNSQNPI